MADDQLDLDDDDDDSGSSDEWLTTFADMTTLLLTFFILLVSMSTIEKMKFMETVSSVRGQFGGTQMLSTESDADNVEGSTGEKTEQTTEDNAITEAQSRTFDEIRSYISRSPASSHVVANYRNGVITLTIPSDALFAPGSETVLPSAEPFLLALREIFLKERQQNINIKGYTDNSPLPPGARFKDNWELSALRAVNILKAMLKGGIEPVRLTATGLGDLEPVAPNTTEENKAKNRRVEFVLQPRLGE